MPFTTDELIGRLEALVKNTASEMAALYVIQRVRELEAENARLRADKVRMDWLELAIANGLTLRPWLTVEGRSFREAIDENREEQPA